MRLLLSIVIGALLCGCGRDENESPAAPPRALPTYGSGTVSGSVKFVGTPPPRAEIVNQPCHAGAETPLKDETVVVNANGTLANVFVYLVGDAAPPSDGSRNDPAVLDQVSCRYVPHAVGVQVGQTLKVKSSDPTVHNVHYSPQQNRPANFGMTSAGSERPVTFDKPEFIRVKCDVHPWMTAYVGVFDNPFFAVSNEGEGRFEIPRVPAGRYRLIAWHEQYGPVEQAVDVKDNEKVDLTVTYKQGA
jgi:plastocyanin